MNDLLTRLKQRSTWAGLATVLALAGLVISPEQWEAISTAVIALIAVYEIFRNEK
jgi:CDP-diglyceride synthetase